MPYDHIPLTDAERLALAMVKRSSGGPSAVFADVVEIGLGSGDKVLTDLSYRPSRPAPRRRLHRLHRIQLGDRFRRGLRGAQTDFELARNDRLFKSSTSATRRGIDGRRGQ